MDTLSRPARATLAVVLGHLALGAVGAAGACAADYRVDLGATLADGEECVPLPDLTANRPSTIDALEAKGTMRRWTVPVMSAQVLGRQISIAGYGENYTPTLTVRIWADRTGSYVCEDPATAGRTRIQLVDPSQPIYATTVERGTCTIAIVHMPEPDDRSIRGSFVATMVTPERLKPETTLSVSGSFVASNPCRP
jgi:hypothetical protein